MPEITDEQIREMLEALDALINRTKAEAFNIGSHFHSAAETGENAAAAALFNKAAYQLCVARDAAEAAKALLIWANDQMNIGAHYSMTALANEPEPKMAVMPTTRFWDGPPVWEVLNAPFEGMRLDSWYIYINEDAKMMGTLEVCAYIDDDEVPILLGIELEGEDERFSFTPEQWVDYIIPRATKYREAMITIQDAGPADDFKTLRRRSAHEWVEGRNFVDPEF